MLILPNKHTSQPQSPVDIDRSNAFSDGLVVATGLHGMLFDAIHNASLGKTGTTGIAQFSQGAFATTDGGSTDVWSVTGLKDFLATTDSVSMLCIAYSTASNTTRKRVARLADSISGTILAIDFGDGTSNKIIVGVQRTVATFSTILSTNAPSANTIYTIGYSRPAGTTTLNLYIDGKKDTTASTVATSANAMQAAPEEIYIGNSSSAFPLSGGVALLLVWNRVLDDNEQYEIAQNPWQVFKAPTKKSWFNSVATTFKAAWAKNSNSVIHQGNVR